MLMNNPSMYFISLFSADYLNISGYLIYILIVNVKCIHTRCRVDVE